jgi:hypothetical protein
MAAIIIKKAAQRLAALLVVCGSQASQSQRSAAIGLCHLPLHIHDASRGSEGMRESAVIFSVAYTWHCERHVAGQYDSREEAEYWAQHLRDHQWHSWVEKMT